MKAALDYFKQSIEEDPTYAGPYSGLADTYAVLGDWQYSEITSKEARPKAKSAAVKALELDDALGEAHNSLAFCFDAFDSDFDSRGEGISARHRSESQLRHRSPLVSMAFERIGPV